MNGFILTIYFLVVTHKSESETHSGCGVFEILLAVLFTVVKYDAVLCSLLRHVICKLCCNKVLLLKKNKGTEDTAPHTQVGSGFGLSAPRCYVRLYLVKFCCCTHITFGRIKKNIHGPMFSPYLSLVRFNW